HRVVWNLHYKGAEVIKGAKLDGGNPRVGPLVNPGDYTVKMTVDGKTETTTLKVLRDPRTVPEEVVRSQRLLEAIRKFGDHRLLTDVDPRQEEEKHTKELDEQLKFALQFRDDITRLTRTVEQIRAVRKQLLLRDELLKDDPNAEELVNKTKDLLPKLDEIEE